MTPPPEPFVEVADADEEAAVDEPEDEASEPPVTVIMPV